MVIGNFRKGKKQIGKWYYGVEILSCNPARFGIIKPYFFFVFVKWLDFGEPDIFDGRGELRKGGWKRLEFPYGIEKIRIVR